MVPLDSVMLVARCMDHVGAVDFMSVILELSMSSG